jgi:hypothetical protein
MKYWYSPATIVCLLLLFLNGCKTTATVDYDRALLDTMSQYQSYAVMPKAEQPDGQHLSLTEIVDRRIMNAVHQVMQARGLRREETQPDCQIAFFTKTEKHTDLQDLRLAGGYYRNGWDRGGRGSYAPLSLDEYEEGTLILDVIDTQTGQLAWRGAASRRLGNTAPEEAQIQSTVAKILAEFPPTED